MKIKGKVSKVVAIIIVFIQLIIIIGNLLGYVSDSILSRSVGFTLITTVIINLINEDKI